MPPAGHYWLMCKLAFISVCPELLWVDVLRDLTLTRVVDRWRVVPVELLVTDVSVPLRWTSTVVVVPSDVTV